MVTPATIRCFLPMLQSAPTNPFGENARTSRLDSRREMGISPGIDDAHALDTLGVRVRRGLLDDFEQEALHVGLPAHELESTTAAMTTCKIPLKGSLLAKERNFSHMEDVRTRGILVAVAKVARIRTFFSSSSLSMECTQPHVPIWWSISTTAVSAMLKVLVKWSLAWWKAMVILWPLLLCL